MTRKILKDINALYFIMSFPQLYERTEQCSTANHEAINTHLSCTSAHSWMPILNGPWKCKDGKCIDKMYVCDGSKYQDCDDKSDENLTMCAQWNCALGYIKCKDGLQCLKDFHMCDGKRRCWDGSDEDPVVCSQWNCADGHWKCKDGLQCLKDYHMCDGVMSCRDGSDEDPEVCSQWNCTGWYTKCKDGVQCLKEIQMCDGVMSCRDGSDEDPGACSQWNCTDGRWKCKDGMQCIRPSMVCQGTLHGRKHCNDGSDEDHEMCAQWNCTPGYIKCMDGLQCLEDYNMCDGERRCRDGSDEDPAMCAQYNCLDGYRKCKDGLQCVHHNKFCDGRMGGCRDKSDEDPAVCTQWNCKPGYKKCADNVQCVRIIDICDNKRIDCKDRSDELCNDPCLDFPLPLGEKSIIRKCSEDSSVCLSVKQYCDGIAQCPDGSDEIQPDCTCEDWGLHSCPNKGHDQLKCFNTKWLPVGGVKQCQTLLHGLNPLLAPREMKTGLYHTHDNIPCIRISKEKKLFTFPRQSTGSSLTIPCSETSLTYVNKHTHG